MKMDLSKLIKVKTYKGDWIESEVTVARSIPKKAPDYMNKLIVYMKSGVDIAAVAGVDYDVFTGKLIPYDSLIYSDGKYEWTSELIYYVEKYGLLPQEDFIKHALSEGRVKITEEDIFGKLS